MLLGTHVLLLYTQSFILLFYSSLTTPLFWALRYFGQLDESKTMGNIIKGLDELSEDPRKQSVCVRRYIEVTLTH